MSSSSVKSQRQTSPIKYSEQERKIEENDLLKKSCKCGQGKREGIKRKKQIFTIQKGLTGEYDVRLGA